MITYKSFPRASDCDNLSQLISSEVPFGFLHSQITFRGDIAGTNHKQTQIISLNDLRKIIPFTPDYIL